MLLRSVLSTCFLAGLAATDNPDSGPVSDPDAPGDSPYNPLPYGHPYPGLGPYQQPFQQERVKIVYVEKPAPTSSYPAPPTVGYPAPTVGYPAPTEPEPAHYRPRPAEEPKANCTLEEVKREEEICGPGKVDRDCKTIEVKYMKISTEEKCYDVTRTTCEESVKEEEREICTYEFKHTERQVQAKGVNVQLTKSQRTKSVEICEKVPVRGYGYVKTYENVCKEAEQTTETVTPTVSPRDFPVTVSAPELVKTCITKRMKIPMIDCSDETESKCTMAPKIEDAVEKVEVCQYNLGKEECRDAKLYLPVQTCTEKIEEKSHYHPTA